MELSDGIPLVDEYHDLVNSALFKQVELESNHFLSLNQEALVDYQSKWVADPLHQWSRQWEYPYVLGAIDEVLNKTTENKILDAGSGATFFPYLLAKKENTTVYCCDYDETLKAVYQKFNDNTGLSVEFSSADLRALPYENDSFDVVYCISVLEHTDEYEKIIAEFFRILKKNGQLIITIDISLDGKKDIDVRKGRLLLKSLSENFQVNSELVDLQEAVQKKEIFTTQTAEKMSRDLLPWKEPNLLKQMKSFIKTGSQCIWPPPLTVYCLRLTKK